MSAGFDSISRRPKIVEKALNIKKRQENEVVISAYHSGYKEISLNVLFGATYLAAFTLLFCSIFYASTAASLANPAPSVATKRVINKNDNIKDKNPENIKESVTKIQEEKSTPVVLLTKEAMPFVYKKGDLDKVYAEAEKKYGVPRQILAAVHYVESGQSGDTSRSSSAGAVGPMQFMQSTFDAYAQDGDGDGVKNITDMRDAIFTAAKHLAANGATSGKVSAALYRYNHSYEYVNRVLEVARSFGYTK